MKIVHLCLSNFYIDGYSYQENELVRQNVRDGHEVLVVASTENYDENAEIFYDTPREYIGADSARVLRIPYRSFLPKLVARKIRSYPGVLGILEKEAPDVILFHGLCSLEMLTLKKYKALHPNVSIYADSHEDFNNSARTFFSKYILHALFYRVILRRSLKVFEKILCISTETIEFVGGFYGVEKNLIEFYPLGGEIISDEEYAEYRLSERSKIGVSNNDILLVQSGKFTPEKRLLDTLHALSTLKDQRIRLIVVGKIGDDILPAVQALVDADPRVSFDGWKSPIELQRLLCAADVYVQPGSQSATMQMSLCCRAAVVLADVPSHQVYVKQNGYLVGESLTLEQALKRITQKTTCLSDMQNESLRIARHLLDYRSLAARLYQDVVKR